MTERDEVYLAILQFGLLALRASASAGHSNYCFVEADHLHNIPSLIGETNELRHDYYFNIERTSYLEKLDLLIPEIGSVSEIGFSWRRYEELWQRLRELRG